MVNKNLLWLLKLIVESDPQIVPKIASNYYECLSSLVIRTNLAKEHRSLLQGVIAGPLLVHSDLESGCKCITFFILCFWRHPILKMPLVNDSNIF